MARFIKWIYLAFGLSLLILLFMTMNYYRRMEKANYYINRISHTSNTLLILEDINGTYQQSANAYRNFLITRQPVYLDYVIKSHRVLLSGVARLSELAGDNPSQKTEVAKLNTLISMRYVLIDSLNKSLATNNELDQNYFIQLEGLKTIYERTYDNIKRKEYELLEQRKNSKDKFESLSSTLLGLLIGFTAMIVSISFIYLVKALKKRIYFEKELREKIAHLNMTNKELENLSRATSHHIQEPLRKIRNFASLIRSRSGKISEEESSRLLGKIESNAESLQTLAQNLVQYANLIQGTQKKEIVNLNGLIRKVEYHLEDRIIETGSKLKYGELPEIWGIHHQLFILFSELVTNAIKFAKDDTAPVIEIEAYRQKENFTTIMIRDNGIGFSDDYADRIFRLFEQLEPGFSSGKGVGLPMCARIMSNHDGSIRAQGKPGGGSCFILEFPDRPAPQKS